jgi:hypothetical protein
MSKFTCTKQSRTNEDQKFNGGGATTFKFAGQTSFSFSGRVGIGTPTVTSNGGKVGTGILWICDPEAGLRAFKAVPVSGVLQQIHTPATGACNKFTRAAFGNGRVYVTDFNGNLYALGT